MNNHEKELEILEHIYNHDDNIRQRDLAEIVGLSLGMTNAIIKRLVTKGFLKVRKVNNRNISYVVSPEGIEAILRKSYRFFKRTIKNVVFYKEAIDDLIEDVIDRGFTGLVLVGRSDLDFIVEHLCLKKNISWVKNVESFKGGIFYLYAETYIPDEETTRMKKNTAFLQQLFVGE